MPDGNPNARYLLAIAELFAIDPTILQPQIARLEEARKSITLDDLESEDARADALIASIMAEVKDVIVIPVPDEEAGEVPRAYVVKQENCRADFSADDVIEYVHSHVAPHKRLRGGVRFTDSIPKTASGKLLRRVQIEMDRHIDSSNTSQVEDS